MANGGRQLRSKENGNRCVAVVKAKDLQTVRSRAGVHFDKNGNIRNQSLRAVLCVSLTDAHQGLVTEIKVVANGNEFIVTDDGPGISLDSLPGRDPVAQEMMSLIGGCGEHKPHPQYAELLCGTSIAEVNAISCAASLATMIDGEAWAQKYSFGEPSAPFKQVNRTSPGSRFRFELDKRYAGSKPFDFEALDKEIRSIGLKLENTKITYSED